MGFINPNRRIELFKQEIYRQLPSLPRLITGEVEEGLAVDVVQVE
jgi:hypothetical protein